MQVASSLHPPSLFHLPSFLPPSDTFLLLFGSLPSFHKDSVTVFLGHTNCCCRPFVQVQRAINVYAVRAAGGAKFPKKSVSLPFYILNMALIFESCAQAIPKMQLSSTWTSCMLKTNGMCEYMCAEGSMQMQSEQ